MHNSLFIRDLIARTNHDPLVRERRRPHRGVSRDAGAAAGPGEFRLSGTWRIAGPDDPQIASRLVEDLKEFLARMGVEVADGAAETIRFSIDRSLGERDLRLSLNPGRIAIEAGGISGLWAGLAWLEFEMSSRRGPVLPLGRIERRAAWPVQISQGPWGGNYSVPDFSPEHLSDESFRLYAHYGVNSMMIYGDLLCYVQSDIFPELNCADFERHLAMLKDAARRGAAYGVRFTWCVVGPKLRPDHPLFQRMPDVRGSGFKTPGGQYVHCLCSSHDATRAFYREAFGRLFREVPELEGLILIVGGESMYHCHMWTHEPPAAIRCPRCWARQKEEVIAELAGTLDGAIKAEQPRAWVAAWAYNVWGWERPDRQELFRALPPGVAAFHHIDKDQLYAKPGYTKNCWDYTVDFAGVSDAMRLVSDAARAAARPLMVKTETGIGLETIQFPYVPAMQRLAEKWQGVRSLAPAGVHQSWLFFGMFNSRAEALGLWAAYAPDMPAREFLRRLAVRDFGPDAAGLALQSWDHMSAAMGHHPVLQFNGYYIGPTFLGPCHPLIPRKGMKVNEVFDAFLFYLQELEETFSHKQIGEARTCLAVDEVAPWGGLPAPAPGETRTGAQILVDEYALAVAESRLAMELLARAEPLLRTEEDRLNWREEMALTEAIYRTFRACENTARFLFARDTGDVSEMRRVAVDERLNALDALPVYERAPWLEFNRRIDGYYSPAAAMIREKVRMIDEFLASPEHA